MSNFRIGILSALLLLFISGCAAAPLLVAGGASAGGVYAVTGDHIVDTFKMSKDEAFEILIGMINKREGSITLSSISEGKIQARVGKTLYFLSVTPKGTTDVEISFRAKKNIELIPDKEAATEFYRSFIKEVMS